jgi:hypothetical protein
VQVEAVERARHAAFEVAEREQGPRDRGQGERAQADTVEDQPRESGRRQQREPTAPAVMATLAISPVENERAGATPRRRVR